MIGTIKTFFTSLWNWWKQRRLRIKVLIVIALAIVLVVVFGGKKEHPVIETAVRQDLVRTVAATGSVVSATDLALSFQESNVVRSINVTVGQQVYQGQLLATVSNASEAAAVQKAQADLLVAQAHEQKAAHGTGGEEITQAELAVTNARRTLFSDDLVARNKEGVVDARSPIITGSYNGEQMGVYRLSFDNTANEANISGLEKGKVWVSVEPHPLGTRGLTISFPDNNYSLGEEWEISIPNKTGASYTANQNAYDDAQASLALKKTTAPSDVDAAHAETAVAQASLAAARAAFEKTVIRAPASGIVTKLDIKLGQLAEMFVPVVTVQDVDHLYIEASVNESSISNVAIGQPVSVTYDALGKDRVFQTTVSLVDLGASVEDGIVNYKVKALVPDPTIVRAGMTANLSIQTARVPDVVVIPERTITTTAGEQSVQILVDERKQTTKKQVITTGLRGDGGLVEVTSGLEAGEKVLFTPGA